MGNGTQCSKENRTVPPNLKVTTEPADHYIARVLVCCYKISIRARTVQRNRSILTILADFLVFIFRNDGLLEAVVAGGIG